MTKDEIAEQVKKLIDYLRRHPQRSVRPREDLVAEWVDSKDFDPKDKIKILTLFIGSVDVQVRE